MAAAGMMLHRFAQTEAYQTLQIEDYHPNREDNVQVQLSINEAGSALVLNILNRTEEEDVLELDLSVFDVINGDAEGVLLTADGLLSMNRLHDQQIAEREDSITVAGKTVKTTVPKLSYGEYIIPLADHTNFQ